MGHLCYIIYVQPFHPNGKMMSRSGHYFSAIIKIDERARGA